MNRISSSAVSLRALLASVALVLFAPAADAGLLDKLKQQAKDTVNQGKDDMQKTVEQEAGIDSSSNPQSLRADLDRMWELCYQQTLTGDAYVKCASICNAARKSIVDSQPAAKVNKSTWKKCKTSHDAALASAKPAMVQSEKEKELGLPAGAMSNGKAAQSTSDTAKPTAVTNKPAKKSAAEKPAAKPVPSPAAVPVASKPAALDAAGKSEVKKFAASCPNEMLTSTYDCGCLTEEYGNTVMGMRAQALQEWESTGKEYAQNRLDAARRVAAEKGEPKILENGRKRYDEAYANVHKVPARDAVLNRVLGESGTGKRCFSRSAIVKSQKQQCLDTPGKKVGVSTVTDETYCGCLANETAANILDRGMQFGPARNDAHLSCDPVMAKTMKGTKK